MPASIKNKGVFITGTDTGTGKTFIGAGLANALHRQGIALQPRKPVETGCKDRNEQLIPADGELYHLAVERSIPLDTITPYRFIAALAPPAAAGLEGKTVLLAELFDAATQATLETDFLIVEGAGGFYSPIASDGLNADLARALQLPVVLVADNRLGCINHILLSLEAIERHGLQTALIVLNNRQADAAAKSNLDLLQNLTALPLLEVPTCSGTPHAPASHIAPLIEYCRQ